jgi:pimeloyl-ACP methyl ester carboxylesterase
MPMNDGLPDIGALATTEIDGLTIRYAQAGVSNGLPILLTAPWPESIYSFYHLVPRLASKHRLILVDLPGFGLSQSRPDVMAPEAMGEYVVNVFKHFQIERAHIVAPDVGTPAFLFTASKNPNLFESMALGGAVTRVELATGPLKDLMYSPPGSLANIDGAEGVKAYLTDAAKLTPAPIIDDFKAANAGRRLEDATQFVRAYLTELAKLEPLLPHIETPILVIAGRNDPIVPPANGQVLADALPNNRLVLLDGGHRIWEEAANAYVEQVVSWIDGGYSSLKNA